MDYTIFHIIPLFYGICIPKLCHEGHPHWQRGARQFLYVMNVLCYMDYTIIHVNDSFVIILSLHCLIVVLCHAGHVGLL